MFSNQSVLATLIALTTWMLPVHAMFARKGRFVATCSGVARCGLFSVTMHKKAFYLNQQCKESCVMFPMLAVGLECGSCPSNPSGDLGPVVGFNTSPPTLTRSKAPMTPSPTVPTPTPKPSSFNNSASEKPLSTNSSAAKYNMELQLVNIPIQDQAIFLQAKAKWETVVTGDLPNASSVGLNIIGNGCIYPSNGQIDDLFICASYKDIDGAWNVVGAASPYYIHTGSAIPFVGGMEFDTADLSFLNASGNVLSTIMHEMGHVMGLGSTWIDKGVGGDRSKKCPYTGKNANREYNDISGCESVPIEQVAARGACGHWDENCLGNELMTGSLGDGSKPLLSRITIGSLQDLGYQVDYSKADSYTQSNLSPNCICRKRKRSLLDMRHGETIPLGNIRRRQSTKRRQQRHLREDSRNAAIAHGRRILADRREVAHSDRKLLERNGISYVGDQVVSVFVRQDNDIFGVVVRRDDNFEERR